MPKIKSIGYTIELGNNSLNALSVFLKKESYSQHIILCDENTLQHCLPILLSSCSTLKNAEIIEVESGEDSKSIEISTHVWQSLIELQVDKKSVIINLGGGCVSDLGGFVASIYKRGVDFINIPTSLLAMADASVGGKTGINFGAIKNSLGSITQPKGVFIYPDFLNTLPKKHFQNGLAEIYKIALISDKNFWKKLANPIYSNAIETIIQKSIALKNTIVKKDPFEKNSRKALNFGHTIAHAIEANFLNTKQLLLHGEAVLVGIIAESWISHQKKLITKTELTEIIAVLKSHFTFSTINITNFETILNAASQDKKNSKGTISCTLLNGIGNFKLDVLISPIQLKKALDFYNSIINS